MNQPRASGGRARAPEARECVRPSGPPNSATAARSREPRGRARRGPRLRRAGSTRSGRTAPRTPSRRSARTRCTRASTPMFVRVRRARPRARGAEMSVATMRARGQLAARARRRGSRCRCRRRRRRGAGRCAKRASASSTISSVSGRGIRTSAMTSKSRPQNSRWPRMQATGSRARAAGRRSASYSDNEPAARRVAASTRATWRGPSRARAREELGVAARLVFADAALRRAARAPRATVVGKGHGSLVERVP